MVLIVASFPSIEPDEANILILGSMPGVASLDAQQYYAHPRNAFWPIMGSLFNFDSNAPYAQKVAALQAANVAVWDVLASCYRPGSLDAAIDPASTVPNDFSALFARHPALHRVFCNGATAEQLFRRHVLPGIDRQLSLSRLPSTSPAHAALSLDAKTTLWRSAILGDNASNADHLC
ncbi:DNA-deoxyinosine glycosylase [Salinispirillum marinum]|uniref:DNA-deoxyinosine glycosylase n=2 Tax=Saccharospirillaceae TaxID=255527 RepID=A0ABV8BBP7_9GAMM